MAIGPTDLTAIVTDEEQKQLDSIEKLVDDFLKLNYDGQKIEVPIDLPIPGRYHVRQMLESKYRASGFYSAVLYDGSRSQSSRPIDRKKAMILDPHEPSCSGYD